MASSTPPLPSEIIFKILSRTSLETLDTCKAVKKEWHDMIFESSFMPQFCANSQNISGYFVQGPSNSSYYASEFVSMDGCSGNSTTTTPFHLPRPDALVNSPAFSFSTRIVASTMQGILCCVITRGNRRRRYHICKPITNQWVKLPNPRTRYLTQNVALIVLRSKPLHFKIIRLSSPPTSQPYHYSKLGLITHYRCEIFDSEYWRWRQGKDILLLYPKYSFFAPAVHAAGLIYFHLCDGQVMALNYDGEEVFPKFSLPNCPGIDDKYTDDHRLIMEYKGKLGCTCLSPNGIMLWVFDNGRRDWELIIKEVDIEIIKGEAKYAIPHGFYNADIALMAEGNRVFFYKLQDKSFNLVTLKKCHGFLEFFPFRSDLEPMDIRMPGANIVSSTKHLYRPSWISFVIVFIFLFGIFLLFSHA
ncbi:hypothetical protein KY285_014590 [Solanum tuberosum]|nr:hypothetical protein KY284_014554 [Solanum tuberosum]KAH0718559.1 hypothetical protein KY285_014590 [Solanum tuberosum]